jgi:hypothetical protein
MIAACQNHANKPEQKSAPNSPIITNTQTIIDTNLFVIDGSYYQFIPATDTTCYIKWGNTAVSNISSKAIGNWQVEYGEIGLQWSNDKFIGLCRGTGSDTWMDIILPLKSNEDVRFYENRLAIDEENGILVYEYPSEDSIIIAENILTSKKQVLGKNWTPCSSFLYHYCIDSVSIVNKELYIEWVTPATMDVPNYKEFKQIKLNI